MSDTAMNLVENEMPCLAFTRVATVASLIQLSLDDDESARLIIIDESMVADLMTSIIELRELHPMACIALSYRKPNIARALLNQLPANPSWGEIGFLPMNINIDCWLSVIKLMASGECYVPSVLFAPEANEVAAAPPAQAPQLNIVETNAECDVHLTVRELEVLESAAAGKQNKIIAEDLQLSQHTVKLHMHHIIAKLGVHNRTEAANWFHGRKLGA